MRAEIRGHYGGAVLYSTPDQNVQGTTLGRPQERLSRREGSFRRDLFTADERIKQ